MYNVLMEVPITYITVFITTTRTGCIVKDLSREHSMTFRKLTLFMFLVPYSGLKVKIGL